MRDQSPLYTYLHGHCVEKLEVPAKAAADMRLAPSRQPAEDDAELRTCMMAIISCSIVQGM